MQGGAGERERLERWFSEGRLLRPDPEVGSSVDLVRALFAHMGADLPLSAPARALHGRIGPADHYIFILIDGFGVDALSRCSPDGALRAGAAIEVRAVFPSTTAAALTSLTTAEYPGRHGVTGWWMYLRDRELSVTTLPFVERFGGRDLAALGVAPEEVYPRASVLPRLSYSTLSITPAIHMAGAYARHSSGGTAIEGYDDPAAAFERAAARVRTAAEPTYTSIYLPQLDELAHDRGLDADESVAMLRAFDRHVGGLLDRLAGRARVIVTGDHGHVPLPPDRALALPAEHAICEMLVCPPVGEPTVPFFYLRDGSVEEFRAAFRKEFGPAFALITREEADALRLFGPEPLSAPAADRVGDVIGIAPEPTALYFGPLAPMPADRSVHAGLTPGEVRVPVAVW